MSEASYYVPEQSRWPILASVALFLMAYGAASLINHAESVTGGWLLAMGAVAMVLVLAGWFGHVIRESRAGLYDAQMDRSFRWGMRWFIFSEVMFFAAFFGALLYIRVLALPWLGGEGEKGVSQLLWPEFQAHWPLLSTPDMTQFPGAKGVIDPWHIPLLNTAILVASSFTLTFSHHALKVDNRAGALRWLLLTIGLGVVFLVFQVSEYALAYNELGLTLNSRIYGSTFFMLTGFHGVHVTMGTLMLIIIAARLACGHFSARQHFGFEATAWYWHFVDVVWVGLFIFVYVI